MLGAGFLLDVVQYVVHTLVFHGGFAGIATEPQGLTQKIMDSCSFHAKSQFFTLAESRLQFVVRARVIFGVDKGLGQIDGAAAYPKRLAFEVSQLEDLVQESCCNLANSCV